MDHESASLRSNDDGCFDTTGMESRNQAKYSTYNGYLANPADSPSVAQPHCEPIYGGTRSMYCRSPPLTRANLQRSQSVYAKSNGALNRESIRANQQALAQSLYPLRINHPQQSAHAQNQNVQNQMQYQTESIYGNRTSSMCHGEAAANRDPKMIMPRVHEPTEFQSIYGQTQIEAVKRRQSVEDPPYGVPVRAIGPSTQSDDSSYGSYQGPHPMAPKNSTYQEAPVTYNTNPNYGVERKMNEHYMQRVVHPHPQANKNAYKLTDPKQPKISSNPNGAAMHQAKYLR